mmetsp:Transcript_80989/g.228178  ORF Transcript_80989/g.228178 Transcript_80989/m.228178 type:complete len:379 (+) Transcript_80989:131-1267(+)
MSAFFKMPCVARWSATTPWNSLFSASRRWLAFLTSILLVSICTLASSISTANFLTRVSSWASFASRSCFSSDLSKTDFAFLLSSFWQYALNFTSSSCCFLISATILSISSLTFSKVSSWKVTARAESCARRFMPGWRRPCQAWRRSSSSRSDMESAASRNVAAAAARAEAAARERREVCSNETDLAIVSRASSSVSTAMASATAMVSAVRVLLRFSHWSSKSLHVNFKLRKNSTSPERCCLVSPKFSLASERAFWLFACSTSISSSFLLPMSISSVFAAARALKSSCAFNSSCWLVVSSSSNSFCICWSTPKISEDLPEDRDSNGAGCVCCRKALFGPEAALAMTRAARLSGRASETWPEWMFKACRSAALAWSPSFS